MSYDNRREPPMIVSIIFSIICLWIGFSLFQAGFDWFGSLLEWSSLQP